MLDTAFDQRFANAIIDVANAMTYKQRMLWIAYVLATFGDLESAGASHGCSEAASILYEASDEIEGLAADV